MLECVAVGSYVQGSEVTTGFSAKWNGTAWSVAPGPNPASLELTGTSCPLAASCLAVGNYWVSGLSNMFAQSFSGTSWGAITAPPSPAGAIAASLSSVSCPSTTTACTAVGGYTDAASFRRPLVMRYQ